jgi:hypothetical protein
MSDLLNIAIAAHGGLERWSQFRTLRAKMKIRGAIRRVYAYDAEGQKVPEPPLVSIDIEDASFS